MDAKGAIRSVKMWATNFYKSFFSKIFFWDMNVCTKGFYSGGVNCKRIILEAQTSKIFCFFYTLRQKIFTANFIARLYEIDSERILLTQCIEKIANIFERDCYFPFDANTSKRRVDFVFTPWLALAMSVNGSNF